MELSGEEKKLQALFSELKAADEAVAPRFARVWNRATPSAGRAFVFNPAFVGALALLVCAVVALAVWSRYRQPAPQVAVVKATPSTATTANTPSNTPSIDTSTLVATPGVTMAPSNKDRTLRRKNAIASRNDVQLAANRKLTRDVKAITDWESPTSALLSSSSDELFSSLPQLNENANGLQSFLPNRPN